MMNDPIPKLTVTNLLKTIDYTLPLCLLRVKRYGIVLKSLKTRDYLLIFIPLSFTIPETHLSREEVVVKLSKLTRAIDEYALEEIEKLVMKHDASIFEGDRPVWFLDDEGDVTVKGPTSMMTFTSFRRYETNTPVKRTQTTQ